MKQKGMSKIVCLSLLFLSAFGFRVVAQAFIVWPGDANNSGVANHVDLLQIGLSWDSLGPGRGGSATNWFPYVVPGPWGSSPLGVDRGYADCNGDGRVDSLDVMVLTQNYGMSWAGMTLDSNTLATNAGLPSLSLAITDSAYVQALDTIAMDVLLGSTGSAMNNLYGLAFSISFDPTVVDDIDLVFNGGWINFDGQALIFQHVDTVLGRIDIAITRRDGLAVSGAGQIGSLGIVMDDDIRIAGNYILPFHISFGTSNGRDGQRIYMRPVDDTLEVTTPPNLITPSPSNQLSGIRVYPSPARDWLEIQGDPISDAEIRLLDLQGREVFRTTRRYLLAYRIPVAQLDAGVYVLEIQSKSAFYRTKVCIGPLE
jgi:hypothetical protein